MTRRLAAGCLLVLLPGAVACGVPTDPTARALDPSAAPYQAVVRDRASPPTGTFRISVFLVRDGALLPVARRVPNSPTAGQVLTALEAGPTDAERSRGLTTVLPVGADLSVVAAAAGVVTVEVPPSADTSARSDAVLGFGQLVLTLTALRTVAGVRFVQDGTPLQVPRADGSLSTGPLGRLDYRELIDPG